MNARHALALAALACAVLLALAPALAPALAAPLWLTATLGAFLVLEIAALWSLARTR